MIAALLDHLWQSTLFLGGAALLALALQDSPARIRHSLWFAASVKFLVPFFLLGAIGKALAPRVAPVTIPLGEIKALQHAAQPFAAAMPGMAVPAAAGFDPITVLGGLWALGFSTVLLIWFARWLRVRIALQAATEFSWPTPITVKSTASSMGPGLFGIWRPVLLLPQGITERLSHNEMRAVIAHELCHLERRDNLTAAIHMLVEALFWFYPLVWWLGARLTAERERACDENVVENGNEAGVYADGILKVCRFYAASMPLTSGMMASGILGADLEPRLKNIMAGRLPAELDGGRKVLLAAGAVVAIAWPLLTGWSNAVADEYARPAVPGANFIQPFGNVSLQHEKTTSQAGCESAFVTMLAQLEKTYGKLSPIYPQHQKSASDMLPMSIEWKNSLGASRYQLTTVFFNGETARVWNARKPLGARYLSAAAVWSAGQADKQAVCLTELDYQPRAL